MKMEFSTVLLLAIVFVCNFDISVGQPQIDPTSTLNHRANVGSTVRMECKVKNVGSSTVTWTFVDHNVLISSGYDIFIEKGSTETRYSVQRPADSGAYSFYTLVITGLQEEDQGHYKCAVKETEISSVHNLNITEAAPPPVIPNVSQNFNFTDCCVMEGVSTTCMPACTPYSVAVGFDPVIACDADLLKILKCASEGKNHAGCCKRRLVPNKCLDLCLGQVPTNADETYHSCLNYVMDMFACVEQGRVLLPSPPSSVSAVANSQYNSILVSWQKPQDNSDLVTFYRIHFKVSMSKTFSSTPLIEKHDMLFAVSNLQANTEYVMYVTAISDHGSSQPSEFVYATTKYAVSSLTKNETIYECCGRRAVDPECQKLLCKVDVMSQLDPDIVIGKCSSDFNNILACYAGERDQSACCRRMNVPDHCFSFCGGGDVVFSWNITQCIMRIGIIDGCIEEGRDIIPGAPVQFKLVNLEWNTAEFSWEKSGTAVSSMYDLFYRLTYPIGETYTKLTVSGNTEAVISGLIGNTQYEAFLVARNENFTSLPTSKIGFLTYPKPISPPTPTPSTTPNLFYNFTACCSARGMPEKCLTLCDYNHYTGNIDFGLALECSEHMLTLLICGSDGRNHESCCKTKGVLDMCIPLCSVTKFEDVPDAINDNPIMCSGFTLHIAQCYTQGIVSLPMAPESVRVLLTTAHSIKLSWDPPRRGPHPQNYTVLYQMENSDTKKMKTATKVPFNLVGLKEETRYSIQVVSVNENGTSVPSYVVMAATLPYYGDKTCVYVRYPNSTIRYEAQVPGMASNTDTLQECESACNQTDTRAACAGFTYDTSGSGACELFFTNDGAKVVTKVGTDLYRKKCDNFGPSGNTTGNTTVVTWANRTECCTGSNISSECQSVCMMEAPVMSPLVCEMDFNKVLACVADGRDHSSCCSSNGVPTKCLGYCRGQALPQDAIGALCLSYVGYFVTCFSQGLMYLPSPPQLFKVVEKHSRHIFVSWSPPKDNCDTDCFYVVQYTKAGGSAVMKRYTETRVNITDLEPETQYTISVTAHNGNGSSLPAPQITVATYPPGFMDVSVNQIPPGVVPRGTTVQLVCDAFGTPTPTEVYWILNNKQTKTSRTITIVADKDSEGLYKCTASVPNLATSTKSLNLNVRYTPTMSKISGDTVPDVGMGYNGNLRCTFRGFPTEVVWFKGDTRLPTNYRTNIYQHPNLETHELGAELEVMLVRDVDLGMYICMGSNEFGTHNGTVYLKKAYVAPTPAPTIKPTPATNVSVCCQNRNVTGVCMDLCTYRINLDLVVNNPIKYSPCIEFFEDYVTCATDGKDHTQCCKNNGVTSFCQDFCGNVVPDIDDPAIYQCIDQVDPILNCIEEGLENIPSPPLNVVALLKGHVIEVNWDPPTDKNNVELYQVWYNYKYNITEHHSVPSDTHTWSLQHAEVTSYRFWVIAKNKAGQSLPGYAKNLTIAGIPPSQPLAVSGTLKNYNQIVLTWTAPEKGPVQNYIVYFSTKGASNMDTTTDTTLTLTELNYDSLYDIKVAANNHYGKGSNSSKIIIQTKKAPKTTEAGQKGGPNAGVVVGVIIVILVVGALVVLGVLFIRKRGGLKSFSRPDSVAFENPHYGVPGSSGQVQISGLPERSPDAGEQTNFDYCPLKEDTDIDPYNSAATLNVDQVGLTMNH